MVEPKRRLVGIAGFKGPPGSSGGIELGYSVVEEWQRQGVASEAARALIKWGFRQAGVDQICAETFPELGASIKVMERCSMRFTGPGLEPGTLRYAIDKDRFQP